MDGQTALQKRHHDRLLPPRRTARALWRGHRAEPLPGDRGRRRQLGLVRDKWRDGRHVLLVRHRRRARRRLPGPLRWPVAPVDGLRRARGCPAEPRRRARGRVGGRDQDDGQLLGRRGGGGRRPRLGAYRRRPVGRTPRRVRDEESAKGVAYYLGARLDNAGLARVYERGLGSRRSERQRASPGAISNG